MKFKATFLCLLFFFPILVLAQSPNKLDSTHLKTFKPKQSDSEGTVTIEGKSFNYKAVAGTLILKNDKQQPTCSVFYVAYFKKGVDDESQRPVTFVYNGGPGSSSVWLHMCAWGPKIAQLADTAREVAPYKLINNNLSLLDATDLVFIDAPGTGFSRVLTKEMGGAGEKKDFFGIDGDAKAFTDFITDFLSTYTRWNSPKYLFGESYGTFRSAAVSNKLESDAGVDLNGVILLSQILDYSNSTDYSRENPGNDRAYWLALPSYAATSWYYNKLPNKPDSLKPFLKEVRDFAMGEYAVALNKGANLSAATYTHIAEKLHEYTGLSIDFIKKSDLRITNYGYETQLLGKEDKITGRLDSRFSGYKVDPLGEYPLYDPHGSTFGSAVTSVFNNYVRNDLHFGEGMKYKTGSDLWKTWDNTHHAAVQAFGDTEDKLFANVMPDLAHAMTLNPKMKVMLNMGYFDLGTPFFEGEYEMAHLPMNKALEKNISLYHYMSGHMVYLHPESFKKLHDNVAAFINSTH